MDAGGYDVNFIDEFSDHLICVVCQMVFREPVSLVECGHTFCHSCFDQIKEHAEQRNEDIHCPTDRMRVDVNKVFDNKAISRLVLDLKVKCNNCLHGCEWVGEVRDLERHLDKDCIIREKKQLLKRMENYEKQLAEKDKRMQNYEKQLEEKGKTMEYFERQLEEKEKRLKQCEKRLNEKDAEYKSLLMQLFQRERINIYREQPQEPTGPPEGSDPLVIKAYSEWIKRSRPEKHNYIVGLCVRKEEALLIKWLKTTMDLWEFRYEGYNMLHNAAFGDCVELIDYITSTGRITINAQCNTGLTSLYYAVQHNKYNAIQALIGHGCNVNIKDSRGDTALDIVRGERRNEIKRMLIQAGGKYGNNC